MDSLAVSAIGLAAGGWQNVKLVGTYAGESNSIPSWKIGLYTPKNIGRVTSITILIVPGLLLDYVPVEGNRNGIIRFHSTSIEISYAPFGCAILFTW